MADMDLEQYSRQGANMLGIAVVAGAIGALVGLLIAPKPGTETREDLKNKYNDMKGKVQTTAHGAKERINRGVDAARHKAHGAVDQAGDALQDSTLADHVEAEHSRRRKTP
jgi:gas vesicle protein